MCSIYTAVIYCERCFYQLCNIFIRPFVGLLVIHSTAHRASVERDNQLPYPFKGPLRSLALATTIVVVPRKNSKANINGVWTDNQAASATIVILSFYKDLLRRKSIECLFQCFLSFRYSPVSLYSELRSGAGLPSISKIHNTPQTLKYTASRPTTRDRKSVV